MRRRGGRDASARPSRARHAALATALLLAACRATEVAPAAKPSPNVVLISIDCVNQRQLDQALTQQWTPAIAELARDGIVFTRAHAQAPWTTPSHMSMLTGLYPSQHGRDVPWPLMQRLAETFDRQPTFQSLADRLTARGYETMAFVGKGSISAPFGLSQGFVRYNESSGIIKDGRAREEDDLPRTEEAIRQWLASRRPRPFFLFVHTYDVHEPRSKALALDSAALRHVDTYVGRILFRLKDLGLYDSSLIILTGDHGSRMRHVERRCCGHGIGHYEENLNVPMIVKLPGKPWGKRSDMLVRHIDIMPTVLDLIDEPLAPYNGPGVSILGRLTLPPDQPDPVAYSFSEADGRCAPRRALVSARYKYIYMAGDQDQFLLTRSPRFVTADCPKACRDLPPEELYDLASDPNELDDLMRKPLAPEALQALNAMRIEMAKHLNLPRQYERSVYTDARADRPVAAAPVDESVKEAMRQLGYAE